MNFKYCDEIPKLPDTIVEEVYQSLNNDNWWSKPDSSVYTIYQATPKLIEWVSKYFDKEHIVRVQKITANVYPHLDTNRKYVYNYLVEMGGNNVNTNFHNSNKDIIESHHIQSNKWHRLDASEIHSVSGITDKRIAITVFKRDFSKADFSFFGAEKLPFKFDIEKLQKHLYENILPIGDPIMQTLNGVGYFGGWSVYSTTGHWFDGWQQGHKAYSNNLKDGTTDKKMDVETRVVNRVAKVPTEICTGYLKEVMNTIEQNGFVPRRARISVLKPKGFTVKHRDTPGDRYSARIHVPIVSYPECEHIVWDKDGNETRKHLVADGSAYMIWVNNLHQIINPTDKPRYHLIMDARDTKLITKNFKFL